MKKYYIPVSVGNPKFSPDSLREIDSYLSSNDASATIVLFDSLRTLANLIRGDSLFEAKRKADVATNDTLQLFYKIFKESAANNEIIKSTSISNDLFVTCFKSQIMTLLSSDVDAFKFVNKRAEKMFVRMGIEKTSYRMFVEHLYIVEETAITLYYLTRADIDHELYIKNEDGLIDYIYRNPALFPESRLLHGGRKFKSWKDIGIDDV